MVSSSASRRAHFVSLDRLRSSLRASAALVLFAAFACGSGDTPALTAMTGPSCAEVAAITPEKIRAYTNEQIMALGTSINCLSDAALGVLSPSNNSGPQQIASITAEQIAVLSPAQVRMIGATGDGGAVTTSKISHLNTAAWAKLVSDPEQ